MSEQNAQTAASANPTVTPAATGTATATVPAASTQPVITPAQGGAPKPATGPTPLPTSTPSPLSAGAATPDKQAAPPAPPAQQPAPAQSALAAGASEDSKAANADATTTQSPAETTPEVYKDLKAPEGFTLETPTWKAVAPELAKLGIKPEQATAIIEAYCKAESAQKSAEATKLMEATKAAQEECRATFKPEDYRSAMKAINSSFKDPMLVEFMVNQLGNQKDFIAGMAAIGRAMSDDRTPGSAGAAAKGEAASFEQKYASSAGWKKPE